MTAIVDADVEALLILITDDLRKRDKSVSY